jgi:uncharacterized protein YjbI with pentapeptide repeats
LAQRWLVDVGAQLRAGAIAWLAGVGPRPSALQKHQGRDDLRGIRLDEPTFVKSIPTGTGSTMEVMKGFLRVKGANWSSLDLTGAHLGNLRFFDSTVDDCVFDGADCNDWRLWNSRISNSSFVGANLRDAALGTWWEGKRDVWSAVDFDRADLRGVLVSGALISGCTLRDVKLNSARFKQATIEDSVISGNLDGVMFDGRDLYREPAGSYLRNVDFSEALFANVEFRGYPFEAVTLPPGVKAIPRFQDVAPRLQALIPGDDSLLSRRLRVHAESDATGPGSRAEAVKVYNRADFIARGGDEYADAWEALVQQVVGG